MFVRFLAASLCLVAPAAQAQHIDWYGSYWTCSHRAGMGEGREALTGDYSRVFSLDGSYYTASYTAWGGVRLQWRTMPDGWQLTDLSVEMRSVSEPSGVYGYLYGDAVLVSKVRLLSPEEYRLGYTSRTFSPLQKDIAALDRHDRWTVVTRTGAGAEIERRVMPVPDRRARDQAFAGYRAVIAAAWKARDEKLLETSSSLPPAPAHCLLSTPETRAQIEEQSRIVDDLPLPSIRRTSPPPSPSEVLQRP